MQQVPVRAVQLHGVEFQRRRPARGCSEGVADTRQAVGVERFRRELVGREGQAGSGDRGPAAAPVGRNLRTALPRDFS